MKHSSRSASAQKVQLNRKETVNSDGGDQPKTSLLKAHGIIMVFAWILFVSTGILLAQFFKKSWPERTICGKAVWFAAHRVVMSTAALLTIVGFILILVYENGRWVEQDLKREFAHSIVGIIVICFAIIQPIMALFRCKPDGRFRFIFNYAHGIVGFSAFILSIVAIFLAMFFTQFDFEAGKEWAIVAAWSCWAAVIFAVFCLVEYCYDTDETPPHDVDSYDMNDYHQREQPKSALPDPVDHTIKDRIKATLLILHILVALGLAIALAVVIGTI